GLLPRLPRIHAVQTTASPLRRAYERVVALAMAPDDALQYAVRHRGDFMWPWETEPLSVATGILDDETYDWAGVIRGMLISGGSPIVVSEERLIQAQRRAISLTGIPVDATGSGGLAGAIEARRLGLLARHESIAVVFTGQIR
ncbi:MAG TPA: hypothetical protein VIL97_06475, partial [Thermoanaerobaculia bacterium]